MIVLSSVLLPSTGPPSALGEEQGAGATSEFLLQLLAQLSVTESPTASLEVSCAVSSFPEVHLQEGSELHTASVALGPTDDERRVLEQLLQMLYDLFPAGFTPFPLTPVSTAVPENSSGVLLDVDGTGNPPVLDQNRIANLSVVSQHADETVVLPMSQSLGQDALPFEASRTFEEPWALVRPGVQGTAFEIAASAPVARIPQVVSVSVVSAVTPAEFGELADVSAVSDQPLTQPNMPAVATAPLFAEPPGPVVPDSTQTAEPESLVNELLREEARGEALEGGEQPTSRSSEAQLGQSTEHVGASLSFAPLGGAGTAAVSSTAGQEMAPAESLAAPDGIDDPPQMWETWTFPPLRGLGLPRNTVVLQVEPPELGTLVVQVRQVDEHFTASFWAESSEVRSLLQTHFSALKQALSEQGLHVQQLGLNLQLGQGFAEQFGGFTPQQNASQPFAQKQLEEEHGLRRSAGLEPVVAVSRSYSSGHVDITI